MPYVLKDCSPVHLWHFHRTFLQHSSKKISCRKIIPKLVETHTQIFFTGPDADGSNGHQPVVLGNVVSTRLVVAADCI